MSLFPAYENFYPRKSGQNDESAAEMFEDDGSTVREKSVFAVPPTTEIAWLQNASFKPPQPPAPAVSIANPANQHTDVEITFDSRNAEHEQRPSSSSTTNSSSSNVEYIQIIGHVVKSNVEHNEKNEKRLKRHHKKKEKREKVKKRRKSSPIDYPRKSVGSVLLKKHHKSLQSDLFVEDLKKDLENLQFGSADKRHVAEFRLKLRECLGGSEKLNALLGLDKNITENTQKSRYFRKKIESRPKSILPAGKPVVPVNDFIPVSDNNGGFELIDNVLCKFDATIQMYRPVVAECSAKIIDSDQNLPESDTYRKNIAFNKLLASNSTDVSLWKEFLRHQDVLCESSSGLDEFKHTKSTLIDRKLAILEKALQNCPSSLDLKLIRLDLGVESADWTDENVKEEWRKVEFLHVNEPEMWKRRLNLAHYFQFSHFTINRQVAIFKTCLEKLWASLSDQLVTHRNVPGTDRFVVTCFAALIDVWFKGGHLEKAFALCQALLEFNFRRPETIGELGLNEKRRFFEPFWDSGAPRIGETNSSGWSNVLQTKPDVSIAEDFVTLSAVSAAEDAEENRILSEYSAAAEKSESACWSCIERMRSACHWLPVRNPHAEPEDPERLVLFDDLEHFLYDQRGPFQKLSLVIDTLSAVGIRFAPLYSSNDKFHVWYNTQLQEYSTIRHFDSLPQFSLLGHDLRGMDEFVQNLFGILSKFSIFGTDDDTVVRYYVNYSRIYDYCHRLSDDVISAESVKVKAKRFKSMVKQMLSEPENRNDLILYVAYAEGLEKFGSAEEALKITELALSAHSFPSVTGTVDNTADSTHHVILFYALNFYVKLYLSFKPWNERTLNNLLRILANFAETGRFFLPSTDVATAENSVSVSVLKAKRTFYANYSSLKQNFTGKSQKFVVIWLGNALSLYANLYAAITYCSARDLTACLRIYDETREFLKVCRRIEPMTTTEKIITDDDLLTFDSCLERDIEKLWENELTLLMGHQRNFGGSPKFLSARLESAVAEFQRNPRLLKTYCDLNLRGYLITGLRRFFNNCGSSNHNQMRYPQDEENDNVPSKVRNKNDDSASTDSRQSRNNPVWWLAAVYTEFSRYLKMKEENNDHCDIHPVRAALEKSVENCPDSILLWRLYMKMESLWFSSRNYVNNVSKNVSSVEDIIEKLFYRAIKHCPGAKDLYLDAITLLPSDRTRQIIDLVTEKELRVRLPWEEFELLWKNARKNIESRDSSMDYDKE